MPFFEANLERKKTIYTSLEEGRGVGILHGNSVHLDNLIQGTVLLITKILHGVLSTLFSPVKFIPCLFLLLSSIA